MSAAPNGFEELGFQRGSADKLAKRPFDDAAPEGVRGVKARVKSYQKGYKRGFDTTKRPRRAKASTGAISVNTSLEFGTSPPSGTEGNADQGFEASLPEQTNIFKGKLLPIAASAKPAISVATRQTSAPFAPSSEAPSAAPPPASALSQTLPGTTQVVVQQPPTFKDVAIAWLKDNWQYVAIGTGVVVVGATIYVVATKKSDKPVAA